MRTMTVKIRKVRNLDLATLNLLKYMDAKCFPEDDPYTQWSKTDWWIAWGPKQNPAGFAGGLVWEPDNYYYFTRAGVLPEFRGNGIQKQLIQTRHHHAKRLGCSGSYTYTSPGNIQSNNNLISSGFKMFLPQYRWAGSEFIYWYKEIPKK